MTITFVTIELTVPRRKVMKSSKLNIILCFRSSLRWVYSIQLKRLTRIRMLNKTPTKKIKNMQHLD